MQLKSTTKDRCFTNRSTGSGMPRQKQKLRLNNFHPSNAQELNSDCTTEVNSQLLRNVDAALLT